MEHAYETNGSLYDHEQNQTLTNKSAWLRKCIKCFHLLPRTKFRIQRNGKPQNACKNCCRKISHLWQKANAEKVRAYSLNWYHRNREQGHKHKLQYRYGLTLDEYAAKLVAQNHCCAICGQPESAIYRGSCVQKLSVDHDHVTGINRGLLCDRCNRALGSFKDSADLLRRAIDYLDKYTEAQGA